MKITLFIQVLSLCIGLSACDSASAPIEGTNMQLGPAPSVQDIAQLRSFLESYKYVGSVDSRDSKFNPEVVLPKIHPWFTVQNGLRVKYLSDYRAYFLKPIPDSVMNDLTRELYTEETPVPLMILRLKFWTRIKTLQTLGFNIGFKTYQNNTADVGVYIDGTKTFLFDTFAEYGTLTHELEHYRQYEALRKTRDENVGSDDLSDSCIDTFGRFLAEVGATTTELPEWVDTFSTYDYKPASYRNLTSAFGLGIGRFYEQLVSANLTYPTFAATWITPSDCPNSLKNVAYAISAQAANYLTHMSEVETGLSHLRNEYLNMCIDSNKKNGGQFLDQDQAFLNSIDTQAKVAQAAIDEGFRSGYQDRVSFVKQTLNSLPENYREVLCKNALAYSLLGDCP